MFESGSKIADAWAGLWMDATRNGTRSFSRGVRGRTMNEAGRLYQRGKNVMANPRKRTAYGIGAVGVSSGAYMWHRHRLQQNQYDPGAPYYY